MTGPKFETSQKLGMLASGQTVFDRSNSHLDDTTAKVISEVLNKISIQDSGSFVERTVDMGREIAPSKVVETTDKDLPNIFYAFREGRNKYSRFVSCRSAEMEKNMTVVLKQDEKNKGVYILITAYVGKKAGLEPYDPRARDIDKEYWRNHAFIPEVTVIVKGSETKEIPEYFKS